MTSVQESEDNLKNLEGYGEIQDKEEDKEFWNEFRGDYIDLRDFLKNETKEEKQQFVLGISRQRVILIREHLLTIMTFNLELRQKLFDELMMLNEIIYSE